VKFEFNIHYILFTQDSYKHKAMILDGMISGAIGPYDPRPFMGVNIDLETMQIVGPSEDVIWNRSTASEAKYFLIHEEHWNGYIGMSYCGTIMVEGTKIPDPEKCIVFQPAPGLFRTNNWSDIGFQIRLALQSDDSPDQIIAAIACILKPVGYVAKFDFMSAPKFANSSEIIELMNKLAEPREVLHETDHMKGIFELMNVSELLPDML